jgi:hypothetical protein
VHWVTCPLWIRGNGECCILKVHLSSTEKEIKLNNRYQLNFMKIFEEIKWDA